jgi:hypothetical protein
MARFHSSDTVTSTTPSSFADDGLGFEKRIPGQDRRDITTWLQETLHIDATTSFTTASASTYTASMLDDGADMLFPSDKRPMFGNIDVNIYRMQKS